jgi:hypothetical protein
MEFEAYLSDLDSPERTLLLVNREAPDPVRNMVADVFASQPVEVAETSLADVEEDTVFLIEDGKVVARSPLAALRDHLLLVNSDLFMSGRGEIESVSVPAVIEGLAGTRFSLWGYPESDSEKLLLILLSRFIERTAWEAGTGRLRVALQQLSRLRDESGTMTVYEHLAETDVDVHLYGVPDWLPPRELETIVHAGTDRRFTDSWFVLYEGPEPADSVGLLAVETEPRKWDGFFTHDGDRVEEIVATVTREM